MPGLLATLQRVRFPSKWRIGPQPALFLIILLIIHIGEKFVDNDQVIDPNSTLYAMQIIFYTLLIYKKDLHDPDNHDGVITHLGPDILECEVKWEASLWTKLVEVMKFFWVISNRKRWFCESATFNMPANLENSAVATGLEKVSFHSNPKERKFQRKFKLPHNCTHLTR